MRFRDDTRGVTVQIGAVLLFATIIIALATYQATVVPAQNADVEYQHSQQAQNQMTEVRNALLQTAATGNARPASLTLGTQYPSRVFLLNPPPAAGTLTTGTYENDTISVSNVWATDDETRDFLDGRWTASTKYLAYQPGYHEYDNAPNIVFGATLLSNHYPAQNATVPLTDQLLVRGNTITLVALNGSVSTSRVGAASVSAAPVSAPYTRVRVEPKNEGEPVNVTVPTHLDADALANATNLGSQENVSVVDAGEDRVTIQLSGGGPFTLQTAKLGVGSDVAEEGAHYLTLVERDGDSVTVEARDRFNNPVSGVTVSVSDDGSNPFGASSKETGEDGRVTFEAKGGGSGGATLQILGGGSARERVTTNLAAGSSGGGDAAYVVEWMEQTSESQNSALTCNGGACTVDADGNAWVWVELFADSSPVVDSGTFQFEVNDTSVGTVAPGQGTTNSSGVGSTTLNATSNGTMYVYASGGGSGDRLQINVENVSQSGGGGGGGGGTAAGQVEYNDDARRHNGQSSGVEFSVRNTGSGSVTVTDAAVTGGSSGAQVLKEDAGGTGAGSREMFVSSPSTSAYHEAGDGGTSSYPLGTRVPLSNGVQLGSGDDATFTLTFFQSQRGQSLNFDNVDMRGEPFEVTLYYADGSQETITVTLPN